MLMSLRLPLVRINEGADVPAERANHLSVLGLAGSGRRSPPLNSSLAARTKDTYTEITLV